MYDTIFKMTGNEQSAVIALVISFICYVLYWGLFLRARGKVVLIRVRFIGFVLVGIIPLVSVVLLTDYTLSSLGLGYREGTALFMLRWIAGLSLLSLMVTWINSHNEEHLTFYPQIRIPVWTKRLFQLNIISWILYMSGYEIMFRGVILFTAAGAFGLFPAVIISTIFYSAVHLAKGLGETAGAFLFGPVLGAVTLLSGSIWVAVIVHAVLAVSNSLFSLYNNKEIMVKNI